MKCNLDCFACEYPDCILTSTEAAAAAPEEKPKSKYNRSYYLTHKAQVKAYHKAYRKAHPEKARAYTRKHYQAHKEQICARKREQYAAKKVKVPYEDQSFGSLM